MPGGRPTKYKPEMVKQAAKLCELGATDQEMADIWDIHLRTLYRWRAEHKEFCHALTISKVVADQRVERSLYQRAIGYEQEAVKIFMPGGSEKPVYAPYRERVQASDTAAIFWLKNRQPEKWRDKQEQEVSGGLTMRWLDDDEDDPSGG